MKYLRNSYVKFTFLGSLKSNDIVNLETVTRQQSENNVQTEEKQVDRFTYLENKYGTTMAIKMNSGKIWKGMSAEMILDSWGKPQKINRSINADLIREEWIYNNSWLFIENNSLIDWGPVNR